MPFWNSVFELLAVNVQDRFEEHEVKGRRMKTMVRWQVQDSLNEHHVVYSSGIQNAELKSVRCELVAWIIDIRKFRCYGVATLRFVSAGSRMGSGPQINCRYIFAELYAPS